MHTHSVDDAEPEEDANHTQNESNEEKTNKK